MTSQPMTVEIEGEAHGFGRIYVEDDRDRDFSMRDALDRPITRTGERVWTYDFAPLNQGSTGTCVGHGWQHFLLTTPVVQKKPEDKPTAFDIYDQAVLIDEWPGNDNGDRNYGTSVRAGAEVLKKLGYIAEYRHARVLADVLDWLMDKGPVVIGVNWYEGMSSNFDGSFVRPTGRVQGGHCVMLQAVNFDQGYCMLRNSWGNWGPWRNGLAHIRFADLDQLLFRERGDAVAGLEVAIGPTPPSPGATLTFEDAERAAAAELAKLRQAAVGKSRYTSSAYRLAGGQSVYNGIIARRGS